MPQANQFSILTSKKIYAPYDNERYALKSKDVDIGDLVYVKATGYWWLIVDTENLSSDVGYDRVPISTDAGVVAVANGGTGQDFSALVADRYLYTSGTGVFTSGTITPFARTLLDDADAATMRATLGVSIGTGDVIGPASSTDNGIPRFDLATGKILQTSGLTIGDVAATNITISPIGANNLTIAGGSSGATVVVGQGATSNIAMSPGGTGSVLSTRSQASNALMLTLQNSSNNAAAQASIYLHNDSGTGASNGAQFFISSSTASGTFPNAFGIWGYMNGPLVLGLGNAECARFSITNRNLLIGGTTDITGSGGLKVFGTAAATSTTSGALQVAGGVGVVGAGHFGGSVAVGGTPAFAYSGVGFYATSANPQLRLAGSSSSAWAFSTYTNGTGNWSTGLNAGGQDYRITNDLDLSGTGLLVIAAATGNVSLAGDLTVSGGNVGVGTATDSTVSIAIGGSLLAGASQFGLYAAPIFSSAATTAGNSIFGQVKTSAAAYTVTNARTVYADTPILGAGSAITTQTGVSVANQGATGVTNAYGIDIAAQSGASTRNIGLRNLGDTIMSTPATAPSLTTNSTMTWELTTNTSLTFKVRGTDGTTRSGTVVLA